MLLPPWLRRANYTTDWSKNGVPVVNAFGPSGALLSEAFLSADGLTGRYSHEQQEVPFPDGACLHLSAPLFANYTAIYLVMAVSTFVLVYAGVTGLQGTWLWIVLLLLGIETIIYWTGVLGLLQMNKYDKTTPIAAFWRAMA